MAEIKAEPFAFPLRRDKLALIKISNRLVLAASLCLGISLAAATYLVTEILYGPTIAVLTALGAAAFAAVFWYAIPVGRKILHPEPETDEDGE